VCLSLQKKGTSDKKVSSRRIKLAQDSKRSHEARSKKLMAMTQRQMQESSRNMAARASLGDKPTSNSYINSRQDMQINSGRSLQLSEANVESGMVLPFEPMIMTFSDVHYYVPLPAVSTSAAPLLTHSSPRPPDLCCLQGRRSNFVL